MGKYKFYTLSFIAGFVLMSLEITASRLAAPIVGTSVYTWTTIIGIILLALSIGNIIGGKLADKSSDQNILFAIILFCGASISAIPFLAKLVPQFISASESLTGAIFIVSISLFFIPSLLMGTIFPFILKLSAQNLNTIGETGGYLSAFSALGSIAGTFSTGFFFIGFVGTTKTLFLLSSLFFLSGILLIISRKNWLKTGFFVAIAATIPFTAQPANQNKHITYQIESDYYNIKIAEDRNLMGGLKIMFLDEGSHSVEPINSTELIAPYHKTNSDIIQSVEHHQKIFMIGGGSYALAKDLKIKLPSSEISAIEIDSEVVKAAEDFFNLDSDKIKTVVGDVKLFLKHNNKYDIIINDAFSDTISVPWQLTTQEFLRDVHKNLNDNGLYVANFISSLNKNEIKFLASYYKTVKSVFSDVIIIKTDPLTDMDAAQNIAFFSFKNRSDAEKYSENFSKYQIIAIDSDISEEKAILLTDDFAPVERLMSPIISKYFKYYLENIFTKYLL